MSSYYQHEWLFNQGSQTASIDSGHLPALNSRVLSHEATPSQTESSRPIIYSQLRKDQAGWVIFDMLKAHAYTFSKNMTYGGACGDSIHQHDIQQVLTAVGWQDILPIQCPSENDLNSRVYPSAFFEKKHGRRMGSTEWKEFIRSHTTAYSNFGVGSNEGSENLSSIVVHIRRRDVTPCCYPGWYLPNSYFASMIDQYVEESKQLGRLVQVQIYSQSESHESWDDLHKMLQNKGVNYTLHLDGPVGDVWRAILNADVFIGSISEFSRVPALFAKGRIPDPRNISNPEIAAATKVEKDRLLGECTEVELVQCKHKWWMK